MILRDVGAGAAAGGCRVRPNHPLFAGLSERAWIEAPHPMAASRCGLEDAPRRRDRKARITGRGPARGAQRRSLRLKTEIYL